MTGYSLAPRSGGSKKDICLFYAFARQGRRFLYPWQINHDRPAERPDCRVPEQPSPLGQATANDGALFTLLSRFLNHHPDPAGVATGPLNATVDTYAPTAAALIPRDLCLKVVRPARDGAGSEERGNVNASQLTADCPAVGGGTVHRRVVRPWGGLPSCPSQTDRS